MAEVNVLRLIRDTAREFSAVLVIERDTMLGLTNVSQPVGEIIERTLRNLLTNVVEHGKGPVHVQYAVDNAVAFLVVKDKGPGLSPAVLKDRSTALHQIARHAKELGGGLEVVPDYTEGACIRLFIPTL